MMKKSYKRLTLIAGLFLMVAGFALFLGIVLQKNIRFFVTPSQIYEENLFHHKELKLGGVVKKGSIRHQNMDHTFILTDGGQDITVRYHGILPALFREDQTLVVIGAFQEGTPFLFIATQVLAKHDETYKPPLKKPAQ